jgi:hypothetical protein
MTGTCPVCDAQYTADDEAITDRATAAHIRERAARDERHREWIEAHTETGSVEEIREALRA